MSCVEWFKFLNRLIIFTDFLKFFWWLKFIFNPSASIFMVSFLSWCRRSFFDFFNRLFTLFNRVSRYFSRILRFFNFLLDFLFFLTLILSFLSWLFPIHIILLDFLIHLHISFYNLSNTFFNQLIID